MARPVKFKEPRTTFTIAISESDKALAKQMALRKNTTVSDLFRDWLHTAEKRDRKEKTK